MSVTVGIDWSPSKHDVCVLRDDGKVLGERVFNNDVDGLNELIAWILKIAGQDPGECPVSIETTQGPLVELLLEREFPVYSLNPKQLDRFRDRFSASGAKDDRRDALVLADSLRTDRRAFRRLSVEEPSAIELREASRLGEVLTVQKVGIENRLRECLQRFYPQALELSKDLDRLWFLAILAKAPSPELARKLRPATIKRLLKNSRMKRLTPREISKILRGPGFKVSEGTTKGLERRVRALVAQLQLTIQQRSENESLLGELLEQHDAPSANEESEPEKSGEQRDVAILLSLPGVGRIVAATLLAEAPELIRTRDYRALRLHSGVAPVTRRSGKRRPQVQMRYACNRRLRDALYHWTRIAAQRDPIWKARYQALRSRGHSHGRACRGLGDRLLKIACAMLRDQTPYESEKLAPAA